MIFSIAMGADYAFEVISIETYALQYFGHDKFFLGSVPYNGGNNKLNALQSRATFFLKLYCYFKGTFNSLEINF